MVGEALAIGVVGRDELEAAGLTATTGGLARIAASVFSWVEESAAALLLVLALLFTGDWLGRDDLTAPAELVEAVEAPPALRLAWRVAALLPLTSCLSNEGAPPPVEAFPPSGLSADGALARRACSPGASWLNVPLPAPLLLLAPTSIDPPPPLDCLRANCCCWLWVWVRMSLGLGD